MKDIVIAIEEGIPRLVNRPLNSPRVVVRVYEDRILKPWERKSMDEQGVECIESSWGD
jgi:ribosome biogenesis protein Tsr3